MKNKYPKIFEPITVKRTTIRNRIAMTPMGTNYGETSGEMSNRHMNYYSLRAKGGTGLIILENANVEYPVGSNGTSQISWSRTCTRTVRPSRSRSTTQARPRPQRVPVWRPYLLPIFRRRQAERSHAR